MRNAEWADSSNSVDCNGVFRGFLSILGGVPILSSLAPRLRVFIKQEPPINTEKYSLQYYVQERMILFSCRPDWCNGVFRDSSFYPGRCLFRFFLLVCLVFTCSHVCSLYSVVCRCKRKRVLYMEGDRSCARFSLDPPYARMLFAPYFCTFPHQPRPSHLESKKTAERKASNG